MSDQYYERNTLEVPFSEDMEKQTLGAVITNPKMFYVLHSVLKADDFYLLRHQWIWTAIETVLSRQDDFDYSIIGEELRAQHHLEDAGGLLYLIQLTNETPNSSLGEVYGKMVARLATRRRLLVAAEEIRELAQDETVALEDVTAATEKTLLTAIGQSQENRTVKLGKSVGMVLEHVEAIMEGKKEFSGIPSGFRDVDDILLGLDKGKFYIVAGRPGMGKSALMLNIAVNLAKLGKRVFFWSGEMSDEENTTRILSAECAVPSNRIRAGKVTYEEWPRFVEATRKILDLPLWMDTTPGLTPQKLRTMLTQQVMRHGVDICIVDYIQLMRYPGYKNDRVQEVSAISRDLKEFATAFNIPLMGGAQLSRAVEQRAVKIPQLSDLRESGSLEQDADAVMFIYREEVYDPETTRKNEADVIIAKHRNGPTGTPVLYWDGPLTRFLNAHVNTVNLGGK